MIYFKTHITHYTTLRYSGLRWVVWVEIFPFSVVVVVSDKEPGGGSGVNTLITLVSERGRSGGASRGQNDKTTLWLFWTTL